MGPENNHRGRETPYVIELGDDRASGQTTLALLKEVDEGMTLI
jgi:hypothetical protein